MGDTVNLGPNPSFIMPSPDGRFLYVSNERDGDTGGVTVGKIDSTTGAVSKLDHESTGSDFVYTSIDPGGKYVLAASYGNGNVSVFPINADGSIEPATDTQTFADGSNAHSIRVDLSGKWAYVPNLGKNEIEQLTFDSSTGELATNPNSAALATGGGTGPRHIAIHPDGKHVYVMFEKTPQLGAYEIQTNGTLKQIDLQRTVPEGTQEGAGSHVLIHPNGKFVYVGNRHQNSIAVFAIAQDGTLAFVESESVRGDFPRNFDIDPSGSVLVVANQGENRGEAPNTGSLAVFSIGADGKLEPLGDTVNGLPFPTGVAIVNLP